MRALSASEQLRVWERCRRQTSAGRALLLLAAASSEMSPGELAQFPIGQRDARLLKLREWMFGAQIEAVAACPECREDLELTFDIAEIRVTDTWESALPVATYMLLLDGYEVRFRPPNSADLQEIAGCQGVEAAREMLLARCVREIRLNEDGGDGGDEGDNEGFEARPDRLPAGVVRALVERMAQIDPQANVRLSLSCPVCRHDWSAVFDIASFLWSEINDWAKRILREIHLIASAYGWGEAEILEMSADRRNIYLEMLGRA
jgi:uncharacterized protein YbaR (Trm112 family)